jgi:hypothetical protein
MQHACRIRPELQLMQHACRCPAGVEAGQQVLQLAAPQLPPDAHKPLAAARQLLAHQQALNQGALHRAQREARELLALCSKAGAGSSACATTDATSTQQADSSGSYSQLQMRLEARRRVLQNLLAAQDYEAALKEAGGLWADAAAARLHMEAVQGLLGLAQVHQAAGHPVGAFPYVLSALLQVSWRQLAVCVYGGCIAWCGTVPGPCAAPDGPSWASWCPCLCSISLCSLLTALGQLAQGLVTPAA